MDQMKSIALSICIVALSFGIIKSILPTDKYEKHMRFLLCLIFLIFICNGIRSAVSLGEIGFENISTSASRVTQQEQLALQIQNYLNEQLSEMNLDAECRAIELSSDEGNYFIRNIVVTNGSDEVLGAMKELTGLSEEQIHVQS